MILNYTFTGQFFKVIDSMLDMVYNIDPITQYCYRSFEEVGVSAYNNALLLDPSTLINNVIYQFGNIFDSVRDVVLFFTDNSRGVFNLPYDAGYGLGNAVFLVLRPSTKR